MARKGKLISYNEHIAKYLSNKKNIEAYLNAALEEEDPRAFLLALKDVIKVCCGGVGEVAKFTKRSREQLYRTLSDKGNPTFTNLISLVDAVGFQIHVKRKPRGTAKKKPGGRALAKRFTLKVYQQKTSTRKPNSVMLPTSKKGLQPKP